MPGSVSPCASSWPTWPLWAFASPLPPSPRCWPTTCQDRDPLWWMADPDALLYLVRRPRQLPANHRGLRPVRGHLSTSAFCHVYSRVLWPRGAGILDHSLQKCPDPHTMLQTCLSFCAHNQVPISSVTSAPSCSWPAPTPFSTTWWCTLWAPCPSSPLCGRLGLLRAHLCCCAEDPIHERPEEGLLHLWLSSLWCLIGVYVSPPPMLNPFIYSLSNKDMKGALGALISRKPVFILQPPHGMPEGPNTVPIWTELPCTVP